MTAMLTAKEEPHNWANKVLLLRWVEKNGLETVFTVTDKAKDLLQSCELFKIYTLTLAGKCVRSSTSLKTFGVDNSQEVKMAYPCKVVLAKEAWPVPVHNSGEDWGALNQKEAGAFINLIGRVQAEPQHDDTSKLRKLRVSLCHGDSEIMVELLGSVANTVLNKNDILILTGARLHHYGCERIVQTAYLTVVEVNPAPRPGIRKVPELKDGEPKHKALKMGPCDVLNANELKQHMNSLQSAAEAGKPGVEREFVLQGKLENFTKTLFQGDPPLVGEEVEKMLWKCGFEDSSGTVTVRLWDRACGELLKITSQKFREIWDSGVEDPTKQEGILKSLNSHLQHNVRLYCKARVWKKGFKSESFEVQINANMAEIIGK